MDHFDKAYEKLLVTEGGFANHPADRGGMTFCGISRVHHPEWPGWAMIDGYFKRGVRIEDFKTDFLMAQVKAFYRTEFWEGLKCYLLPYRIACELFDSAVNCGTRSAAKWLQLAANYFADQDILTVDGVVGEKSIAKVCVQVQNFGDTHLLKVMNGLQFEHYRNLVDRDDSQRVFFRGWLTRVWEDA